MKLRAIIWMTVLTAFPVMAHIEVGTYSGETIDGSSCSMKSLGTSFLDNKPHPLNERVEIEVQGQKFTMQHPVVISVADSVASFNHDSFQGVVATPVGGTALVIEVEHAEGRAGPKSFALITHAWKKDERTKLECLNLSFQQ